MTETLLNAPIWLMGLLVLVGAGLLVSSLRGMDKRLRSAAIACFAAAVLLAGVRYLVPTDEKKVESETRRLATAVGNKDWPTVSALVKDATLVDLHGEEVAERAKRLVDKYSLTSLQINSTETKRIQGVITVTLSITTHHDRSYADTVPSTWAMEWQRRSGVWVLTDIRAVRIASWGPSEAESYLH